LFFVANFLKCHRSRLYQPLLWRHWHFTR